MRRGKRGTTSSRASSSWVRSGVGSSRSVLAAFEVLPIDPALHAMAQDRYQASLPTGTSFVDHVSLAFMEQTGINTAFVLDSDFEGRGLAVLPGL